MNQCFLVPQFTVSVIYVHLPHDPPHQDLARRFVASYEANPPGHAHDLVVICNGSSPNRITANIFRSIPGAKFLPHDDSGWDIGAFQKAAREVPCDLMVFLGSSVRFFRAGWLARMVQAWHNDPSGLYGTMGNMGMEAHGVYPHIRTTGFWCDPALLNAYPKIVTSGGPGGERYEFEHGRNGFTGWVRNQGREAYVTSWDGEYRWPDWDLVPEGFHKGNQSNMLLKDRLTDPPYYHQTA